jgi:superfamily II DNA or RNA helicase
MKGVRKTNEGDLFPASPTLVNSLNITPTTKQNYLLLHTNLLARKNDTTTSYDARLRPYQNSDVHFLIALNQGKGVFNQQRTGKTPTTLVTMREKQQNRNMIFVPKSAVLSWYKEYKKWHGGEVYYIKDHWNAERRKQAYAENKGTLITNYDKAFIDYDIIKKYFKHSDAIIVDEAHEILRNYSNPSSHLNKIGKRVYNSAKVATAITRLRKICTDAYALTGTPTANKEIDIYGILAFLFPELFQFYYPTIEYYFNIELQKIWSKDITLKNVTNFKSPTKKQELLEFIETFSISRKRKDVMPWLPKVDIETIELEKTVKQRRWMLELEKYFETEHVVCENALTTMIALRQIATCPKILGLNDDGPKFKWIKDHLKDYPNKPIIFLSAFTEILKLLKEYIKPFECRLIYGDSSSKQRFEAQEAFQNREYNILLANIEVFKVNLTFSKAEEIVFLDPSLTYVDNEQAEDRFLPISEEEAIQKEDQKITRLVVVESIDTYIQTMLAEKQEKTSIINNYIQTLRKERKTHG